MVRLFVCWEGDLRDAQSAKVAGMHSYALSKVVLIVETCIVLLRALFTTELIA